MSTEKKLGKIQKAEFGMGGYQDAMFGVSFQLGGDSWGVGDFWGTWADRSEHAKWTLEDQKNHWFDTNVRLRDVLKDAKKDSVSRLVGTPVEIMFEGNTLKSWRVLKEVV